jgi:hypothetical protein
MISETDFKALEKQLDTPPALLPPRPPAGVEKR